MDAYGYDSLYTKMGVEGRPGTQPSFHPSRGLGLSNGLLSLGGAGGERTESHPHHTLPHANSVAYNYHKKPAKDNHNCCEGK